MKSYLTSVTTLATLFILSLLASNSFATEPLRLAYPQKVCYEPFIIAKAKGYFAAEGLKVDIKRVNGGILAAESLMTGATDIAAMGDAPFLIAASRSHKVQLVTRFGGGSKMHRMVSRTGITDIQQLEGARVGIQMGSSTYGAMLAWAQQNGLDPKKITFVPLNPLDIPQAMLTGQIDAMAGSEPWPTNTETTCGAKVHKLTDFSSLGNSFPIVIAATDEVLKERQEDVEALLRAVNKAITFMHNEQAETVKILSAAIGLPEAQQRQCTYQLDWGIGFTPQDEKSLNMTAEFLEELGKIDSIPHFSAFASALKVP